MSSEPQRDCSYDWIRDREGTPRRNANGTFTMQNEAGACFSFTPATIKQVQELLEEIKSK
jgi:hypothetical protein